MTDISSKKQISDLLTRARALWDSMTLDERIHHRHEQRISFASGNTAIGYPPEMYAEICASAARAAGPCPCDACRVSLGEKL